ncbi:HET-domain-containing protein [Pholiota conissans]|uniref:HET-domain-containing protein n=1 Tax=Pholiota conissans TaxID=109636 RepID=A0A9P6CXL6_9AGAR|nr:HET-domain-containing protein [Pholiota conissans]
MCSPRGFSLFSRPPRKKKQPVLHNRALLCDLCWKTPFSIADFQSALAPDTSEKRFQGFSYTTQTWKEIEDGENRGCNWCDIIWGDILEYRKSRRDQSLRTEEMPEENERWKVTMKFTRQKEYPHYMTLTTYLGEDMFPSSYKVHTNPEDNAASIVSGRNIIWKVSSPECFQEALNCLVDCTMNHEFCPKVTSSPLPTRVVDCSDPRRPKLLESQGLEAPYVALSYVWGQAQPHSTSTVNIESYTSDGIDIEILPQTIRDAIYCTHALGFRFLWTDTLCIIQDSADDKNNEISQMCNIYNKAHFTIIAACATKAGDGFLQDRRNPPTMELPFWCPDGRLGTISVREQLYASRNEPISKRGWCFQERLLSPRILNYASHTLQYQCAEGTKNVGNANNFSVIDGSDELKLPNLPLTPAPASMPVVKHSTNEEWKMWRVWKSALANYSGRSLTCSTDKLVALSGVAQFFVRCWSQEASEIEYLAGLWKHTFAQDILWYRDSAAMRRPRPVEYRAPSWSWAASDGPIKGPGWPPIVEPTWTVRKCKVFPTTSGLSYGEVQDAILVVEAVIRPVSFGTTGPNSTDVPLYERELDALSAESQPEKKAIGFVYMDADESLEGNVGFAVVVGSMNKKVLHNLVGLLLVPVANAGVATYPSGGCYRRVGLFDVHEKIEDESDEPFCDVEDWLKTTTQVLTII